MSVLARSSQARHVVMRFGAGDRLPDSLAARLREEGIACGWVRASGVASEVELRAFDAESGALGAVRRIAGPVHVLSIEGSVGLCAGEPTASMRALVARETDRGLETFAGEIASARVVGLEAIVMALDDVALERALDPAAGVWLLGTPSAGTPKPAAARPASPAWTAAVEASEAPRPRMASSPGTTPTAPAALPPRPARAAVDFDAPFPEPGDVVDHFAFGRCDVLKSDGDRLHLKVHKDGRIREIALEMLRVTPQPEETEGKRRFRLERRI